MGFWSDERETHDLTHIRWLWQSEFRANLVCGVSGNRVRNGHHDNALTIFATIAHKSFTHNLLDVINDQRLVGLHLVKHGEIIQLVALVRICRHFVNWDDKGMTYYGGGNTIIRNLGNEGWGGGYDTFLVNQSAKGETTHMQYCCWMRWRYFSRAT